MSEKKQYLTVTFVIPRELRDRFKQACTEDMSSFSHRGRELILGYVEDHERKMIRREIAQGV
jgi:hypothetical protein